MNMFIPELMSVKQKLLEIRSALPSHVSLVAVSKTKPVEMILQAYEAGHRDFGENYVQELLSKQEQLPKDIRWHFIGHLQSNKTKLITPFVYLIHGVDSMKLLEEINKQAAKHNRRVSCLLQIHIASEETKFGFSYEECRSLLLSGKLDELHNAEVIGLMAMASNTQNEAELRKEYRVLSTFFSEAKTLRSGLKILSCGMSNDFLLAIEEGSNMVRIGSSIFGSRN